MTKLPALALLGAASLIATACDSNEAATTSGFDDAQVVADFADHVIIPTYAALAERATTLRVAVDALAADPTEARLGAAQDANDAIGARDVLMRAFRCDVSPLIAEARLRSGGALDPIRTFRATGYRQKKDAERPQQASFGGGIV